MLTAYGAILNTMKTTIIKVLPFLLLFGVGLWFLQQYNNMRLEVSNTKWELATMTNRAESAEYSLAQEKKWQEERKKWNAELDVEIKKFKKQLDSYTTQLKDIENERTKSGVNNSLSEPVTRVLKQFNSKG